MNAKMDAKYAFQKNLLDYRLYDDDNNLYEYLHPYDCTLVNAYPLQSY